MLQPSRLATAPGNLCYIPDSAHPILISEPHCPNLSRHFNWPCHRYRWLIPLAELVTVGFEIRSIAVIQSSLVTRALTFTLRREGNASEFLAS